MGDESEPKIETVETDQSPTLGNLFAALAKAQGDMKPAKMDSSNPHFGHPYASLDSILDSIRKPLSDNELAVVQRTKQNGTGILMETTLGHSSGEWMRSTLNLILKSMAKKGEPEDITMQSLGSAITYARRYGLAAITGAVSDADDDGNAPSAPKAAQKSVADRHPESGHVCPIHKTPFKVFDKDGQSWYAHKVGDKWCNEKAAKAQEEEPLKPPEPAQAALDEAFGPADHAPEATSDATKPATAPKGPTLDEDAWKSLTLEQMRKELLNFQKVDRDRFGRIKVSLGLTSKVMSDLTADDCFRMAKALLAKAD